MKLEQKLRRLSREERLRLVEKLREIFGRDKAVLFAYLHGSIVGEGPLRDVDVAVWLRGGIDPVDYILRKALEVEAHVGMPVDIQVLNLAPPTFRYTVYTRGLLLVVNDRVAHDLEVAKATLIYIDLRILRRSARGR